MFGIMAGMDQKNTYSVGLQPPPPPPPHKAQTGCSFCVGDFCCAFTLSTMVGVGNATGAAMRRRQRRLRAWARHERLSIAMALATVEHHSYGPTANAAPRGQTTGTSAREGEVHEQHYGPQAQKRLLPPGCGQHRFWMCCRRCGFCGTPWSRGSSTRLTCRSSTLLCRRWWKNWWIS